MSIELPAHPRSLTALLKHGEARLEEIWLEILPHLTRDYFWIKVDDLVLYGAANHQAILAQFVRGSHERFMRKLLRKATQPGMMVLDIGAHVGYYTLLAARLVGPAGKVLAFECDPRSYRFLRHNVKLNNCNEIVTPIPKAVAAEAKVSPFFLHQSAPCTSSLWEASLWKQNESPSIDVECTTVDDVIGDRRVDVIKLNIEGNEIEALKGMEKTFANSPRMVLFVECKPRVLSAAGGSARALVSCLLESGFSVQIIDEKERVLKPISDELYADQYERDKSYYRNLYCRMV
jgi:FkbM family methyltransferase